MPTSVLGHERGQRVRQSVGTSIEPAHVRVLARVDGTSRPGPRLEAKPLVTTEISLHPAVGFDDNAPRSAGNDRRVDAFDR